ncbi:hypothetical protein HMI55_003379 [Coelomomyces lativittatus]|nr:hypothetical protein HMI55_003379 [Coelomomyces lativittatus]
MALCNAIEITLAHLETIGLDYFDSKNKLRQLLILLENPLLDDPSCFETLLRPLIFILSKLPTKAKSVLVNWWSQYPSDLFTKLVTRFQRYLSAHLPITSSMTSTVPTGGYVDDAVIAVVRCLGMMYASNERGRTPLVSYTLFYNVHVSTTLPFKEEYKTWRSTWTRSTHGSSPSPPYPGTSSSSSSSTKRIKSTSLSYASDPSKASSSLSSLSSSSVFSFFNYPFLFDTIAKARILHIDAMVQMSLEYEEACVSQALVVHTQKLMLSTTSNTTSTYLNTTHSSSQTQTQTQTQSQSQSASSMVIHPSTSTSTSSTPSQGTTTYLPSSTSNASSTFDPTTFQNTTNPYLVLEVRRSHLVMDVLSQLQMKPKELKKPLKVKFVHEEGMDQGGVTKEFFQVVLDQLLDPNFGMFTYDTTTRNAWFQLHSLEPALHFELVGMLLGLAIYNGVMLDVRFPLILYKLLLNEKVGLKDVVQAWPDLGHGFETVVNWSDPSTFEALMLYFEVTDNVFGQMVSVPLKPNGHLLPVLYEERQEYIDLYVEYLCVTSIASYWTPFYDGVQKVCGGPAFQLCRAEELELLVCGQPMALDFKALQSTCQYEGYLDQSDVVIWFWDLVHTEFSLDQKKKLLEFVTASDRIPLKGLASLTFVIQRNGPDSDRLPTALTCFGRLLLPEYLSKEKLKRFLLMAIENAKGFGLI